ncbi:ATP-grasp fold amidoligase family protein [Belnapia rosea]|uniref:TupA-like ATPgrasp n=1 Tax=Belnapia rosea TaxID=938405 RepID=A0A1G6NJG1_9PROT|nr:ATP-grasp fold amidoligase family protein [Belnapia rosea]SDB66736.1 TupA-like ATPgrasp [Belnapia rosea]SDC67761.1 TupA-like ATPgrasp [Belnapia rosea]
MSGIIRSTGLQGEPPLDSVDIGAPARAAYEGLRKTIPATLRRAADALPILDRPRAARRLQRRMEAALGYTPNLRRPRTFNEHVAWKILNDRSPLIPLTTDKITARDYVASKGCADLLLPHYGVWDRAEDIPWDDLPEQFVLKASHGWQMNLVVRDKSSLDRAAVTRQAAAWLAEDHYQRTGEWGYHKLRPRLLAEMLITGERPSSVPEDFKFYVFRGRARLLSIHLDRGTEQYGYRFYAPDDLRPLPFMGGGWRGSVPYAPPPEARQLAAIAGRLGEDFDFVRVDLYFANGRAWFGELTHYPASACIRFPSLVQDRLMGDMWSGRI